MEINYYILIIIASLVQFVLGALWYSPLMFGKWWMQIMGADEQREEELKKMQKEMMPFYGLQFILTLMFTFTLSLFITPLIEAGAGIYAYGVAGAFWLGLVVPTQISGVIWANTKKKFWLKQIFIMTTFQLVGIMLATFIFSL